MPDLRAVAPSPLRIHYRLTLLTVLTVFREMNASGLLCFRLGLHD
jgi:hypothetical protein